MLLHLFIFADVF